MTCRKEDCNIIGIHNPHKDKPLDHRTQRELLREILADAINLWSGTDWDRSTVADAQQVVEGLSQELARLHHKLKPG